MDSIYSVKKFCLWMLCLIAGVVRGTELNNFLSNNVALKSNDLMQLRQISPLLASITGLPRRTILTPVLVPLSMITEGELAKKGGLFCKNNNDKNTVTTTTPTTTTSSTIPPPVYGEVTYVIQQKPGYIISPKPETSTYQPEETTTEKQTQQVSGHKPGYIVQHKPIQIIQGPEPQPASSYQTTSTPTTTTVKPIRPLWWNLFTTTTQRSNPKESSFPPSLLTHLNEQDEASLENLSLDGSASVIGSLADQQSVKHYLYSS